MADQNEEFRRRLEQEQEEEFRQRLEAEKAAAGDKPNRWQQLQAATGVDLADPLAATVAGGLVGGALGKPLEKGLQAAIPGAPGPGGEPPGWKWARKTGFGEGQGLTVREQDEAFKAARKPIGSGKVSSTITKDKPININEFMRREAQLAAEAEMKAKAARDAMTVGEKIAEKSPAWLRTVGRGAAGVMEALPPWMVRTAAGAGAGMQGVEAYNRLKSGDIGGGLISGLGALGSAAALVPHPLVRGIGTAVGMGAPMLNEYLDTRAEGGHIDGYAGGSKVIGALSQLLPAPMKASQALGRFEGRPLLITQTDRSKVGEGMLGGPGFSSLQLSRPEYKAAEAGWGVNSPQTANTILGGYNRAKQQYGAEPVMTTMIGTPTQHQSNQMVFDALLREFMGGAEQGKLTPALQAKFNERLRAATNRQTGAPLFAEDVDVMAPDFRDLANTFDRRAAVAQLFGGTGIGGKKGQIFDYDKIIRESTDPTLLDAPSGALGNRMFTLTGGSVHNPELHPAFPHILQGEDLGLSFAPVPRELVMRDFAADVMRRKGREPGYMDYTRGYPPTQLITDTLLKDLERKGFKEGGLAKAGLYANINAKRKRIEAGSGEKMRKPGAPGAPTAEAFEESAKTAKMKKGGDVSLAVGRGEKLPVEQGAGLTAKGRAKYNRETGSNLKAPQPEGGPRKKSFCARMRPIAEKSERGSRARASMRRWNCSGFAEGGLA